MRTVLTFFKPRKVPLLVVATLWICALGCRGDGIDRSIVSGYVTLDGKPIENGEIRFTPTGQTPGTVSGGPIVKGKYVAKAKGGVPVGSHIVKIKAYKTISAAANSDERDDGEIQYIPKKYNLKSELSTDVANQSKQTIDFDLKRK